MSKISNYIFNNVAHKVTSPFGPRDAIYQNGKLISAKKVHEGTDYAATGSKKSLDQFAIEDGYVFAAAKSSSDGALYVWVIYPRIKKAMLHYHLASYAVKAGQKVSKGTLLGVTGRSGLATGIHLHLGIRDLSKLTDDQINKMTWDLLRTCSYVDPEKVAYTEPSSEPPKVENPKTETPKVEAPKQKYDAAKSFDKNLAKTFIVSASAGLHIRAGASTKKTSFGVLKEGTKCQCFGYYTNGTDSSGKACKWLCVVANGITGYVCANYVK